MRLSSYAFPYGFQYHRPCVLLDFLATVDLRHRGIVSLSGRCLADTVLEGLSLSLVAFGG